ncbi:MAG: single-stranded DNA-binding protein [Clostridia bacterium]|nr:single-stranded DNA-binding protein [Bacteroidales bacterium]MBO5789567.1 single-stranded DNA-binding protein [Clostridia bacterium]MBO7150976.1 single-stranded DNA-binding protein [Clostridia bacterium]
MANFNFNKTILGGRLTADPELKQTASGISACTFTIAVNRRYAKDGQQEADFITCQAWRKTAEFICKHFKKGSSICVTGAIQTRNWTDNNGQKRYATDVVVDEADFVDGKNAAETTQAANPGSYIPDAYKTPQGQFEPISEDQTLPF